MNRKKTKIVYIVTVLLITNLLVCNCSNDRNVCGIQVPSFMFQNQDSIHIGENEYCTLLEDALHKDSLSLRKFVTLGRDYMFDGEGAYCHGTVIVELIERVGEDFFIKSINDVSFDEKQEIWGLIGVGIEYRHSEIDNRSPKDLFPKVDEFLRGQGDQKSVTRGHVTRK